MWHNWFSLPVFSLAKECSLRKSWHVTCLTCYSPIHDFAMNKIFTGTYLSLTWKTIISKAIVVTPMTFRPTFCQHLLQHGSTEYCYDFINFHYHCIHSCSLCSCYEIAAVLDNQQWRLVWSGINPDCYLLSYSPGSKVLTCHFLSWQCHLCADKPYINFPDSSHRYDSLEELLIKT